MLTNTAEGVRDAWDFWLSQHDYSVADRIEAGARDAITAWLDANTQLVVDAIARQMSSTGQHEPS
jgi:hypothetical protein